MSDAQLRLVEDRPPSVSPPDPLVGRTIDGRYRIEAVLGEGGMGLVYRARHTALNKLLAIKVLRPEVSRDAEVMSRFQQEAQSASAIGNHHIIDISDFGVLPDGATYFVMEFLDGISLTKAMQQMNPMPAARVIHIAKQLCDALGAAHERNIVHRDLKPDNVYLVRRGSDADFVKVLDFGIAKVGGSSSKLTKAGQVFGTPHYMSPEQCSGSPVDQRTDIYALGVMLYEMSSGRVPFDADNLMGILTKHVYEQPIPPRELPPPIDVPPGLEAVIMKCLAKSADARYQTMAELREDLERVEAGSTPQAVIDAVDRASGARPDMMRPDGTGRVALARTTGLRMGAGDAPEPPARGRSGLFIGVAVTALVVLGGGGYLAYASLQPPVSPITTEPRGPRTTTDPAPTSPTGSTPGTSASAGAEGEGATASAAGIGTADQGAEPSTGGSAVQGAAAPVVAAAVAPVRIETEPEGAEVLVGGLLLGVTPLEVPRPSSGQVTAVTLRLRGYREESLGITEVSPTLMQRSLVRVSGRTGRPEATSAAGTAATSTTTTETTMASETTMMGGAVGSDGILDPWQ